MLSQSTQTNTELLNKGVLQEFSWKEFLILVFAGMVGVLGALPSAWDIMEKTATASNVPVQFLAVGQLLQSALWMFFAVGIGLFLARKTGLGAPLLRGYLAGEHVGAQFRSYILPSALLALFATVVVAALDRLFFLPRMPGFSSAISQVSGWNGILASFYGGITEEILSRLFIVTLLVWFLSWFLHTNKAKPSAVAIWIGIIGSAVIFGLGHLPATLASTSFSVTVLARAVLLNGIYGTVFGFLYCKRGLESSMMAHFTSDVMVHVVLPAMVISI